jgi:DNA-binding CsgD family transcriptional regulator
VNELPFVRVCARHRAGSTVPPGWRVVGLAELPDVPFDLAACRLAVLGAAGDDPEALLLAAVRGCAVVLGDDGERPDEQLLEDLGRVLAVAPPATQAPLDPTQLELLRLLAEGRTLADAARRLGLSRRTAMRRVADARQRFGVTSTMMAIRAARDVR